MRPSEILASARESVLKTQDQMRSVRGGQKMAKSGLSCSLINQKRFRFYRAGLSVPQSVRKGLARPPSPLSDIKLERRKPLTAFADHTQRRSQSSFFGLFPGHTGLTDPNRYPAKGILVVSAAALNISG